MQTKERIEQIVTFSVSDITQRIAHFPLSPSDCRRPEGEAVSSVVIALSGVINAELLCIFPDRMIFKITDEMSRSKAHTIQEQEEYFKEFINIVAGRITSRIYNEFKDVGAVRYKIMDFEQGGTDIFDYPHDMEFGFVGTYGIVIVLLRLIDGKGVVQ